MRTTIELRAWLTEQIAGILSLPEDEIDPDATFDSFGLASRDAVSLSGDLEDYLGRRLSPTLLYQYPTISELADFLAETKAAAPGDGRGAAAQPVESRPAEKPLTEAAVEAMSEEEAEAALLRKLHDLDE